MSRYCPKCGSKLWHEGYCRSCLEFTTLHTSFDDGQEELKKPKHIDQINHQVNAASNNRMPNSVTPITHTDSGSSNLIGAVLVAIPTVISCITNVTPFIGIVFYFLNFPTITIACAILQLLNSVIQCINGTQKGLFTEIITLVGAIFTRMTLPFLMDFILCNIAGNSISIISTTLCSSTFILLPLLLVICNV